MTKPPQQRYQEACIEREAFTRSRMASIQGASARLQKVMGMEYRAGEGFNFFPKLPTVVAQPPPLLKDPIEPFRRVSNPFPLPQAPLLSPFPHMQGPKYVIQQPTQLLAGGYLGSQHTMAMLQSSRDKENMGPPMGWMPARLSSESRSEDESIHLIESDSDTEPEMPLPPSLKIRLRPTKRKADFSKPAPLDLMPQLPAKRPLPDKSHLQNKRYRPTRVITGQHALAEFVPPPQYVPLAEPSPTARWWKRGLADLLESWRQFHLANAATLQSMPWVQKLRQVPLTRLELFVNGVKPSRIAPILGRAPQLIPQEIGRFVVGEGGVTAISLFEIDTRVMFSDDPNFYGFPVTYGPWTYVRIDTLLHTTQFGMPSPQPTAFGTAPISYSIAFPSSHISTTHEVRGTHKTPLNASSVAASSRRPQASPSMHPPITPTKKAGDVRKTTMHFKRMGEYPLSEGISNQGKVWSTWVEIYAKGMAGMVAYSAWDQPAAEDEKRKSMDWTIAGLQGLNLDGEEDDAIAEEQQEEDDEAEMADTEEEAEDTIQEDVHRMVVYDGDFVEEDTATHTSQRRSKRLAKKKAG